jgi:hypothetical protein
MRYWIFVNVDDDNPDNLEHLLKAKSWGFEIKKITRKKIEALQPGDKIVFYAGGKKGRYLAGEAVLTSSAHAPTREPIGGPKDMKLNAMVDFEKVDQWNNRRVYLTDRAIRDRLDFIKNKDNWGMSVGQSVISISADDYNEIKSMV